MSKLHLGADSPNCQAARNLLSTVGSKWVVVVIERLSERPKRFSELRRDVGDITQKSLTSVLRDLEREGIVDRKVTPTIPPRVDYELTELGVSLAKTLHNLISWAVTNQPAVAAARLRFEQRSSSS